MPAVIGSAAIHQCCGKNEKPKANGHREHVVGLPVGVFDGHAKNQRGCNPHGAEDEPDAEDQNQSWSLGSRRLADGEAFCLRLLPRPPSRSRSEWRAAALAILGIRVVGMMARRANHRLSLDGFRHGGICRHMQQLTLVLKQGGPSASGMKQHADPALA